jgi:hypothetical protein
MEYLGFLLKTHHNNHFLIQQLLTVRQAAAYLFYDTLLRERALSGTAVIGNNLTNADPINLRHFSIKNRP